MKRMDPTSWPRSALAVLTGLLLVGPALAAEVKEFGPAPLIEDPWSHTGRVSAVACSPTDAKLYYIAAADGGVWRTSDGGVTWTPLTDYMPTTSMGALAIDPTDENVIYAGTGEANYANHSRYGLGLYKSVDGGDTWVHLAQSDFAGRCCSRIIVNAQNPQVVYVAITRAGGFPELAAAKGHPGATGPVGVFRSADGGVTWTHLMSGLPALSATDLAMEPGNPNVLYAGIGRIFGDADNGLYKTTDGGDSWTKLTGAGLPSGTWGRISVAVAPSQATRVYTLITNPADASGGNASVLGAYRSDDSGATWADAGVSSIQASYGWYLSVITINPQNADTVFMGGVPLHRSNTAGTDWTVVTPPHVDMHGADWDAAGRLVIGDDGGVHRSDNLGFTWTALNDGLGVVQFYAGLCTNPARVTYVLGGTQDNGTNFRASQLRWYHVYGGDGGWTQINLNRDRIYVEYQGTGTLYRSASQGGFVWAGNGISGDDRNCFLPPYLLDPASPDEMIYASHRIYYTSDGGGSWTVISDDLTGGGDAAVRTLARAPSDSNVIYAATNDSRVLRSDDGGVNWTLLADNAPGWPRTTREIWVHPTDPMTVYLAVGYFGQDQVRRSTDGGQTWEALDGNLPDIPVNAVTVDVRGTYPVIYAGADDGLYRSINDGRTWHRYGLGLPHAAVIDLLLEPEPERERVVVATQGRGAWRVSVGIPGDANCDGSINLDDINYFVQALHGEPAWSDYYASQHGGEPPPCRYDNADCTGEGRVTFEDIVPLVEVLGG